MNRLDFVDAIHRVRKSLDPEHQRDSMENASGANHEWEYSGYTADEPQSSVGVDVVVGGKRHNPPSSKFYMKEDRVEDPDGESLVMDEVDEELSRKQKELEEIEERILHKKVAIALKHVEPSVKGRIFPCKEHSAHYNGSTLRDRVNVILQQQHAASSLSKVQSPKERMNSFSRRRAALLQEDHPLKLRVKALMKKRSSDPGVLPPNREVPDVILPPPSQMVTSTAVEEEEDAANQGFQRFLSILNKGVDIDLHVPDVILPPPSQMVTSTAVEEEEEEEEEEDAANQGFHRFLSILNKGVDIDLLSKIVNDDSEDMSLCKELLNTQPDPPTRRSHSRQTNSGASLLEHSRSNSGERKTHREIPSQERSLNERLSLPDEEEKMIHRGSRSPSKSPPAPKKKKAEKPEVDEQREHLQNILKALGMSMEVEEINKMEDRTQERLYGKKPGDKAAISREVQESQQGDSQRLSVRSSSSSASSSSSSSTSSSGRPIRRRRSYSRDSEHRRTRKRSRSRDRSRDGRTWRDDDWGGIEAQKSSDEDEHGKETSIDPHPYPQHQTYPYPQTYPYHPTYPYPQMYPYPQPAASSAFPGYSTPQDSQYSVCHSSAYSAASSSYWKHTQPQGAIPPTHYPSGYPYPQNTYYPCPRSTESRNLSYPKCQSLDDTYLLLNPDLSKSEGQTGSTSGPRCLQVISTKQPTTSSQKRIGTTIQEVNKSPIKQLNIGPIQQVRKRSLQQPKRSNIQQPNTGNKKGQKKKKKKKKKKMSVRHHEFIRSRRMRKIERKLDGSCGLKAQLAAREQYAVEIYKDMMMEEVQEVLKEVVPQSMAEAPQTEQSEKDPTEDKMMATLRKKVGEQTGSMSGPRCLQVVSTKQPTISSQQQLRKGPVQQVNVGSIQQVKQGPIYPKIDKVQPPINVSIEKRKPGDLPLSQRHNKPWKQEQKQITVSRAEHQRRCQVWNLERKLAKRLALIAAKEAEDLETKQSEKEKDPTEDERVAFLRGKIAYIRSSMTSTFENHHMPPQ